jgi:hypothetical protein
MALRYPLSRTLSLIALYSLGVNGTTTLHTTGFEKVSKSSTLDT